jgi:hypothetical protein
MADTNMTVQRLATATLSIVTLLLSQYARADDIHPSPAGRPTLSAPHTPVPGESISPGSHIRSDLQPHTLNSRVYYGSRPWPRGVWRHETRRGRYGWWWDTGGIAYFYNTPSEGPPDHVSEVTEPDEEAPDLGSAPAVEPSGVYFYRPGDLEGVAYDTLQDCREAQEKAGNKGICIVK